MTEPVTRLFARAEREGDDLPVPALGEVLARGHRLRRRRRVLSAGAASAVLVGAVLVVRPGLGGASDAPMASTSAAADRFLEVADLGAGGWVRAEHRDATGLEQPACAGSGLEGRVASGTGGWQLYRGSTPQGAEWLLQEHVVTVGAKDAAALAERFRSTAAPGCTRPGGSGGTEIVLAADATTLVTGTLRPEGSVAQATAYVLSGTTWIAMQTLPGGASGQIPLPGQTRWLLDVTARAVERATGTRPALPEPNAAARAAAAKYVAPTRVLHVPSSAAGPPTGAPTGAPKGFLAIADLGPRGDWTVKPDAGSGDYRVAAALPVTMPTCGGSGATVDGKGASLMYRGQTSGGSGEWILSETVVTLRGDALARARTALAAAATCPGVGGGFDDTLGHPVRASGAGPTSLVLGYPLGAGTGFATAWALHGSTLVQLDTLPGGAAGGAALPGGTAWLRQVLASAVTRATG